MNHGSPLRLVGPQPAGVTPAVPTLAEVQTRIDRLERAQRLLIIRHGNADWVHVDELDQAMADLRAAHPTPVTAMAERYADELLADLG